jgi:hypothetical protein
MTAGKLRDERRGRGRSGLRPETYLSFKFVSFNLKRKLREIVLRRITLLLNLSIACGCLRSAPALIGQLSSPLLVLSL